MLLGNSSAITGGTLTTSGTGVIRQSDGTNVRLSGVTLSAGSTYLVGNGSSTLVNGGITNNGNFQTTAAGNVSFIRVNTADGVTFNGTGTITLQDPGAQILDSNDNRTFTNGVGHTIQGQGNVGGGSTLAVTNNGLITANVNAANLVLQSSTPIINAGTLKAENGGTLQILNTAITNNNLITAANNSTVLELAKLIWEKIHGASKPFNYTTDAAFRYDVQCRIPDVNKAKDVLGFEASTSLDEILDEVIPWIAEQVKIGVI